MKSYIRKTLGSYLFQQKSFRKPLKWIFITASVGFIGLGVILALLLTLSIGIVKDVSQTDFAKNLVQSGTEQVKATALMIQSSDCRKQLGGFLDVRVWLKDDVDAHWNKTVDSCLGELSH